MLANILLPLLALSGTICAASTFKKRMDYSEKGSVKGVNLGGWFVIEPFINPSLFEAFGDDIPNDEYHYTLSLGKELAYERLNEHWGSWITEADFETMSGIGLNFVRIPVGYWALLALDGDPYVQGQLPYLDQALEWCAKYNIQAWIDLHGVPGSQNGFDNSGYREDAEYLAWFQGDNLNKTYEALSIMSERYGGANYSDVVAGIELVNEPLGTYLDINTIAEYYDTGYKMIRDDLDLVTDVIMHDAFRDQNYWDPYFQLYDYWGVVIDHHRYQVFSTGELARTIDEHVDFVCKQGADTASEYHWSLTGEWSAALTDCTYWLNGVGRGARYDATYQSSTKYGTCDGINDISTWTDEQKQNTRKFIEAQMDAYDQGAGWIFWTWKTENALEWDFQRLVYEGLVPQPLTDRQYPNQCGY
ncbi:glucan 1,3-beta-glucosidase [Saccharomycopsis crataegensis]|uniref:glucan 1,3-beta-glucosidase n=1 Tax=Saccharomycopsis crataegensis TaxID=43959 RepID=A0AAV5QU32_9ASCO|nr:glucan 1,3-beta-glucosidase [Saccharomycopsis crataegensis]